MPRLALLLILSLATLGRAAEPRVLRDFDFEDRSRGNVEDLPTGWLKVEGSGLPHWVRGTFDDRVAFEGKSSYRVDLDGGSALFRLPAGRIRVAPGAVYRVSCAMRTTALAGARARVRATCVDQDGRPIEGDAPHQVTSGTDAFDRFVDRSFDVLAPAGAASIVIEFGLLQPSMLAPGDASLETRRQLADDIRGSAWFDALRVVQMPQVRLSLDRPDHLYARDDAATLRVWLRDATVSDLSADLRISDLAGRVVFQRTGDAAFVGSAAGASGDDVATTAIPLPPLPAGWYTATLSLRSADRVVNEHSINFVRLAEAKDADADARFGFVATKLPGDAWPLLPDLCRRLSVGRVKLAAWPAQPDAERSIERLRRAGLQVGVCLAAPSKELLEAIAGKRWTDLLSGPAERWQPIVTDAVARFGTLGSPWQFLDDDAADGLVQDAALRATHAKLAELFGRINGSPADLAVPWPAWYEPQRDELPPPPGVALVVPEAVLPEQIGAYVDDARRTKAKAVSVTLRTIDRGRYGVEQQSRDVALRVAHALAAGIERIDLPVPFTFDGRGGADPEPIVTAERTLFATLANARFVGVARLADDVDAFCFERNGRGLLMVARTGIDRALVNRGGLSVDPELLTVTLGGEARRLDLDGSRSTLPRVGAEDSRLDVGLMPFFVTDVDLPLVMLRASLSIDQPAIESNGQPQLRTLRFKNDFAEPIRGTIRLDAPDRWIASMPANAFDLQPGQTFEAKVSLVLPGSVRAGPTRLLATIKLDGRDGRRLTLPVAVDVGLSDIGLRTFAVREANGDVVVQQFITNYGRVPLDYTAFVSVPGRSRQERLVSGLPAGKTVIRRYRFANPPTEATQVRSSLKQLEGDRTLNQDAAID